MGEDTLGNSVGLRVTVPAAEMRVALQSILGFAQLLQHSRDGLNAAQRRYLANIEGAAGSLLAHTSAERARPGRLLLERVVIDVDSAVAGVVEQVRPAADQAGVRLQADRCGLAIHGDREQFEQMLVNLLSCAIRASGGRGHVRLRVHPLGEGIQLSVVDTAIAIPRELTLAKRLAEMMGGELEWMQDAEDRTSISVRLPAPQVGRAGGMR